MIFPHPSRRNSHREQVFNTRVRDQFIKEYDPVDSVVSGYFLNYSFIRWDEHHPLFPRGGYS